MDAEVLAAVAERLAARTSAAAPAALVAQAQAWLVQLDARPLAREQGSPLAERYAFLSELFGLCAEECVPAGRAFNRLPERVRRAFFDLLPPRRAAPAHDAQWTRDVRVALDALRLSPLDDAPRP